MNHMSQSTQRTVTTANLRQQYVGSLKSHVKGVFDSLYSGIGMHGIEVRNAKMPF